MDNITVEELDLKQKEVFEARAAYDAAKKLSNEAHARLGELQGEHIARLESVGKTSYKNQYGTFSFSMVEGVKIDPENKSVFWEYLRDKGLFEEMITVHSATLNAFAKEEMKGMEMAGDIDPQIPGLVKSEPHAKASMRKS